MTKVARKMLGPSKTVRVKNVCQLGWNIDSTVFEDFRSLCNEHGWQYRDVIEPMMLSARKVVEAAGLEIKRPADIERYIEKLVGCIKTPGGGGKPGEPDVYVSSTSKGHQK